MASGPRPPMSPRLAVRYPSLIAGLPEARLGIAAHGLDMDHLHHGGLAEADERRWIEQARGHRCARLPAAR